MGTSSRRRLCIVERAEPSTTGTSRYVAALTPPLERAGFEITHVATRPSGATARALGTLRTFGLDANAFLASYPLWMGWPHADVYHLTVQTYAGVLRFRPPPGPAVVTVHDVIPYLLRGHHLSTYRHPVHRWFDRLAMRSLRRATALIADSEWTKRTLVERLGLREELVSVVHLGVEHNRFQPRSVPAAFRQKYDLPAEQRYILYVGSEDPRKDLGTLWHAFAQVRRDMPDVRLLKVGAAHHQAQRTRLLGLAAQLGIAGTVRFFDEVSEADLALFYNVASVFAMPSLYEGFGLPVLEAMACGTPVVHAAASALPEITGSAALHVPPGDPSALAHTIRVVLTDGGERDALRQRGIRRAAEFSWDVAAAAMSRVYEAALGGPRSN